MGAVGTGPAAGPGGPGGTDAPPGAVIAVDGGSSKTDLLVIGLDGALLAHARGPGANPQALGARGALAVIRALLPDDVRSGRVDVTHSALYLSGLDFPAECATLRAAARTAGLPGLVEVENDTFALLRAGVDGPEGVAVVCGSGINCIGRTAAGQTVRFPAIGPIGGDFGGGGDLCVAAMFHAARARDGRGPATALAAAIPAELGCADLETVIEQWHAGRISQARQHSLVPLLFRLAADGDEVARSVLVRQGRELALLAAAALRRLDALDREVPVVLGGGIAATRDPLLIAATTEHLAGLAPLARLAIVERRPVLGAGLLALERIGAGRAALDRLATDFEAAGID